MKVTLIRIPHSRILEQDDAVSGHPHLGLAYVAGYLRSRGIDCTIYDGKFDSRYLAVDKIKRNLLRHRPKIIGFTAMTNEIEDTAKAAEEIKKMLPTSIFIIGGVHATALPRQTLLDYPVFDIAVFGEGEHTMYELVKTLQVSKNLEGIKGIAFRNVNKIEVNEPRELIKNLDELPLPAWDLFPNFRYFPVLSARGCPYQCIFCMRVLGNKLRKRSVEMVVKEIETLIKDFNANAVGFVDETFTADKHRVNELLDLLIEKNINNRIVWSAQTRADLVDYRTLLKMKKAGCVRVDIGVESGNPDILKTIKKGITLEQAANAVRLIKRAGLECSSYFILGHPFETLQTAQDTIEFASKLNTTYVAFGIMVPYPGTEVYEMAKKGIGGYNIISKNWSDFNKTIGNALELDQIDRKTLERLQLLAYLRFYIFNLRVKELAKLIVRERRVWMYSIRKILSM